MAAFIFALQFKPVQTYVAKKAANYFSNELNTRIELESIYLKPFKSLVLEGLYIQDLQKDTLLYSPKFTIDLSYFSLSERRIEIVNLQLDSTTFYLKDLKDKSTNLDFIINYFNTGKAKPKINKPAKRPFNVTFNKIVLNNAQFRYKNFRVDTIISGINFNDLLLKRLNASILNLDTKNHLAKFDVKHLNFLEKSGFYLKNLTSDVTIDSNKTEFKNLLLQTNTTRLSDYILLSYSEFRDFGKFISKIKIKAHLEESHLNPQDIAYFSPQLKDVKLSVNVSGDISGYVNDLKTRNFTVKAGNATYLKGNFNIKGLPKINETFLDLDFEQVYTNKKDADYIVKKITGSDKIIVPPIIEKFGNINFKGRFTGFPTDFIAFGEFKTKLGRVISDVNMKISAIPVYSGTLQVVDFNLGNLINEPQLGRTTFSANFNGSGFNKKNLKEKLISKVTYFDFRGYRYKNILVDGTFNKNLFSGKVNVNDANIKLAFNGSIDLNPELPKFYFSANVKKANLHRLKLTKDTIQIEADLQSNFTGNSLDNIQGDFQLRNVGLNSPRTSFLIDSVSLFAEGLGKQRLLSVSSDILDASIKGEYDLKTLPSYFKTVVKKYIPSLQTNIVKAAPQNFDFDLKLKYFEPLSILFFPELKLPEGAMLSGKFSSSQKVFTFNAFAKLAEYKSIKINNFIIDQTSNEENLNIFVTSDRIDISDSLYIKNVNIANILRNDSLNLNIKLSDKNATNQLDLNGLVYFSRDSSALFSVLPSDVIINKEVWKIQEQVRIGFNQGKTTINNFELSNNNQIIKIDGIISTDAEDNLNTTFNQFKLATFNSLTKSVGATLGGTLNGDLVLSSLLKTPKVQSTLTIDSLTMNGTEVGDLNLEAAFDEETRLVDVIMDIVKQGDQTLNITGTYDANKEKNSLNMAVKMDRSELIIFEPFLKKLVSNLRGKVSADLSLTGNIFNPKIDGSLQFIDAGLIVNYLKTPYKINDDVTVENSVIQLNDLIIRDIQNHEAHVNGTVDMKNPNNPDINITINTRNFMALNTKARDNPNYYGVAYGTGTFSFKGPTDDMNININAKTEEGTVFNIPLNSSEIVSENDFITFVSKDTTLAPKKKENTFKGLVMNFDLTIDENTEVNIFTDIGKLSGRGKSEALNLKITTLGDFEMKGDFLISDGKFEFTAQDYINKIFDISQGGSIRWTGNPTNALINLRAVYGVRTSIRPLYIAAGRGDELNTADQRVLAEAIMNLSGDLLKPTIAFDLNFPTDTYIKDVLQGFFSDVNNKNQQALSLIVRRSFSPNTGLSLGTVNSTLVSAGAELLFNQFNNIIAQSLNLNFVDLNIRSFNEASASVRLWNDRLVFTYGVTDRRTELNDYNFIGSSVARDVEALYLLRRDGSLVLRASNRLNNRSALDNLSKNQYVNAIGIVYRQEFDSAEELLKIFIGQKRREERNQKPVTNPYKPIALKPEETIVPNK